MVAKMLHNAAPAALDAGQDARTEEARIVDTIQSAVLEQRLPSGTKLSEATLCAIFGVGRARIRRALLVLASREIIALHPNRGAYVAEPTAQDARDIFETRRAIEPTIIRNVVKHATGADLKRLSRHLAQPHGGSGQSREEAITQSGDFHLVLAAIGRNSVLEAMLKQLVARTSLIIGLFGTAGGFACSHDEHQALLQDIIARDAEKAAETMFAHLSHIESHLHLERPPALKADLRDMLICS